VRRVRSAPRHHGECGDNQKTTANGGRENQPSPTRQMLGPQFKQHSHAVRTIRRMIHSRVRQGNLFGLSGNAFQERFARTGADRRSSPVEDMFLMLPCDPCIKAIFRTREPTQFHQH
jgi:hypothetical protein